MFIVNVRVAEAHRNKAKVLANSVRGTANHFAGFKILGPHVKNSNFVSKSGASFYFQKNKKGRLFLRACNALYGRYLEIESVVI